MVSEGRRGVYSYLNILALPPTPPLTNIFIYDKMGVEKEVKMKVGVNKSGIGYEVQCKNKHAYYYSQYAPISGMGKCPECGGKFKYLVKGPNFIPLEKFHDDLCLYDIFIEYAQNPKKYQ